MLDGLKQRVLWEETGESLDLLDLLDPLDIR
jgi:hypothetical protein